MKAVSHRRPDECCRYNGEGGARGVEGKWKHFSKTLRPPFIQHCEIGVEQPCSVVMKNS